MSEQEMLQAGEYLLRQEAAALDERDWDGWLSLYTPDCELWVPSWRDEEVLTEDPKAELSHLYYASRGGLEDRVWRLRTGRAPALIPLPRTSHMLSAVLPLPDGGDGLHRLRCSWATHVYFPHEKASRTFFGRSSYALLPTEEGLKIRRKTVVLNNDLVPRVLEVIFL